MDLIKAFEEYMIEWKRLDVELDKWKPPFIGFFIDMWILHKKSKLTKEYTKKYLTPNQ